MIYFQIDLRRYEARTFGAGSPPHTYTIAMTIVCCCRPSLGWGQFLRLVYQRSCCKLWPRTNFHASWARFAGPLLLLCSLPDWDRGKGPSVMIIPGDVRGRVDLDWQMEWRVLFIDFMTCCDILSTLLKNKSSRRGNGNRWTMRQLKCSGWKATRRRRRSSSSTWINTFYISFFVCVLLWYFRQQTLKSIFLAKSKSLLIYCLLH